MDCDIEFSTEIQNSLSQMNTPHQFKMFSTFLVSTLCSYLLSRRCGHPISTSNVLSSLHQNGNEHNSYGWKCMKCVLVFLHSISVGYNWKNMKIYFVAVLL